ncbi:DUF2493 domain-containing protein [Methylobacterium nodulans]|uniref:YspA cpYpsA-related SLOG domain-containing protein n=1 Tax=Methylobacterium nodulans (strain LMG 21967 / CNCM I-2342 / ORS 2060) TaxID=460265 RepID=B8IQM9_METNO|nr:DUF2493 domain-containing protein [Methylobacterium nodulans]ACL60541.1 conserved hypothetical protein [Methylobacterium nodulans ORS 2060]
MTRVLVTGGRGYGELNADAPLARRGEMRIRVYREVGALRATLDALHAEAPIACIIQGSAPGADRHARDWSAMRGVELLDYPADWHRHGRAAGPLRNARMIAEGQPDLVLAFPGGRGTADCVRKAEAAGIRVVRIGGE